jgi:hypothetical protein
MKAFGKANWWQRLAAWFRRKQLERELRSSEKLQKECERLGCFTLVESEKKYQAQLQEKLRRAKGCLWD